MSPLEEGKVKGTDTAEAVGAETKETPTVETPAETMETAFEEGGPSGAAAATTPEIDWTKHGLENFQGKPIEEIAEHLKFQNRQYGTQANELGELRRQAEEYKALKAQISGKETPAKAVVEQMNDVELALFADAFNQNPHAAIEKFIVPKIEGPLTDRVFAKVEEKFGPVLDKKTTDLANKQEFAAFARANPGCQEYFDVMQQLMTKQYVGEDVDYDEAYKLAVLAKKESSLFGDTCELMKHGVSFDKAKEYASLKQSASSTAEAKAEQVKKEVAGAAVGGKRTVTKQAASEPVIKDMDDAFASTE